MIGPLAAVILRPPCFSIRATAAASIRAGTSWAGPVSCRPTLMPGSANCTTHGEVRGQSPKPRAGHTAGASFFVLADLRQVPLAIEAVRRIDEIFAVEREINGATPEQRHAVRQERIKPLVAALEGWMRTERARLSRHADTAKAIDYMLKRWPAFTRFLDDGRICLTNNAAERALRGIAMRRSLCPSSSSTWKHWKLVCRHAATRTTCSFNRSCHPFLMQIVGTDLVGSARHNLLGGENAVLDQPADAVVCNPERRSGLRHREPFAILLGGTVGIDSIHPAHRADTVRSPGFSLTGGHSHPVQGRGDVLVRPSG